MGCVNGNLSLLEIECESKLCVASPSRHAACVPPVLSPVSMAIFHLVAGLFKGKEFGKPAIYGIYNYSILIW